jgi:hypothetical protein
MNLILKRNLKNSDAICEMVSAHNKTGRSSKKDKGLVFAMQSIGPLSTSVTVFDLSSGPLRDP